jgi:hypothetical protein
LAAALRTWKRLSYPATTLLVREMIRDHGAGSFRTNRHADAGADAGLVKELRIAMAVPVYEVEQEGLLLAGVGV